MAIAASTSSLTSESISNRTRSKQKQPAQITHLSSLPDIPFRAVACFLGQKVLSTIGRASATLHNKVCTVMAESYLAHPQLRKVTAQYVQEKDPSTVALWDTASSDDLVAMTVCHVTGLFRKIVEQSDLPPMSSFFSDATLTPLQQSLHVALCDAGLPLDGENLVASHRNPLDISTMALRAEINAFDSYQRTLRRFALLFPVTDNVDRANVQLGLDKKRQEFVTLLRTNILPNRVLWLQECAPLLDPLFASFLEDPERAETLYVFLREQADSLTERPEKDALLELASLFQQWVEKKIPAADLRRHFINALKNPTLPPTVVKAFCQQYLTADPELPILIDTTVDSPIPGLPLRARFPEAERFLSAILTRKITFGVYAMQTWMESDEIKALLRKRDYLLIFEQIIVSILHSLLSDLFEAEQVCNEIMSLSQLSQKQFSTTIALLRAKFSSHVEPMHRLSSSSELNSKLQTIRALIAEVEDATHFTNSETRVSQVKAIAMAMTTYILAVRATLPNPDQPATVLQGLNRLETAPLDAQAMQSSLEDPAVALMSGDLTSLNFSRLGLSSFPVGLFPRFPSLEDLTLYQNPLQELPPDMQLPALQSLIISNTLLRELPEGVWLLPKLEDLIAANCCIERLPQEGSSFFTASPDTIAPLTGLNMSGNRITRIPEGFLSRLPQLEQCVFVENNLRGMPTDLPQTWPVDSFLTFSKNPHLRKWNIPPSIWRSKNATVKEAMEEPKIWQKERLYHPRTPLATFYKACLFRKPRGEITRLCAELSPRLQSAVGLAIWNLCYRKREEAQMDSVLSPEALKAHNLHDTLTAKKKIAHGLEHLLDDRAVLLEVVQRIIFQLYDQLTLQQQAALLDLRKEFCDIFSDPSSFGHRSIWPFTPFVDRVLQMAGEDLDVLLLDYAEVIGDMDEDWEDAFLDGIDAASIDADSIIDDVI